MVYENCSELTILLATFGGIFLYLIVGMLVGYIVSSLFNHREDFECELAVGLTILFWPMIIVAGVIYLIGMWILFPLFGATKEQLDATENRLRGEMTSIRYTPVDVSDNTDMFNVNPSFKVGDIITGIIPQTNVNGENISYEHLYKGCKCRVLSITSTGSMKVILIDHKDKEAHKGYIGDTFTAPARNFTLVKKIVKRSKVAKKKAKK